MSAAQCGKLKADVHVETNIRTFFFELSSTAKTKPTASFVMQESSLGIKKVLKPGGAEREAAEVSCFSHLRVFNKLSNFSTLRIFTTMESSSRGIFYS